MARISVHPVNALQSRQASPIAGIWIEGKRGTIGLVADDNVGTYLCFYGPNYRNRGKTEANPLPALVISLDDATRPQIQIPSPGQHGARFFSLDKLLNAIERIDQLTNYDDAADQASPISPAAPRG